MSSGKEPPADPHRALAALWRDAALPAAALEDIELPAAGPVVASSFAVATAVQASLGAAALAAVEIDARRGGDRQRVRVPADHAVAESSAWFRIDGAERPLWDKVSGLYRCGGSAAPGHVRLHANFAHHRDGALRLLGLPEGAQTERAAVAEALAAWPAEAFEQAAADAGLVVAAARRFEDWDRHPQGRALAGRPPLALKPIDGPPAAPRAWPARADGAPPLAGLRVLDLTRILAGPAAARTLAACGADVLMVNAPHLPNIDAIADLSRGKRSCLLDLRTEADRATLRALVREADVFLQGYRPGALAALGFGPEALAALRPGIVCVSLAAYGFDGPWAGRRGFDSLVQTATGFNGAEAEAFGVAEPKAMPIQVLDYSAGYLLAFGAQAALMRQREQGGSWEVQVSLAGAGHWLRGLGRVALPAPQAVPTLDPAGFAVDAPSGFGLLRAVRPAAQFSRTPAVYRLPAMPPGAHPAAWAAAGEEAAAT